MDKNENTLKVILKEIRAKENGPAVDTMDRMGMKYNKNFGVALFDLKIIASKYKPNHKLAQTLRNKNIRETRILAEMIEDDVFVTEELANKIVSNIDTIELAEQTCINLFKNLKFAYNLAIKWIKSDKEFIITSGFILISLIASTDKFKNDIFIENILEASINNSTKESIFIRKSIARALRQIALKNNKFKKMVLETCENIKEKNSPYANLVLEEVVPLINY